MTKYHCSYDVTRILLRVSTTLYTILLSQLNYNINTTLFFLSPPLRRLLSSEAKFFSQLPNRKLKKIFKQMVDHENEKPITVAPNPGDQILQDAMEPTNLFAKLRLNSFKSSAAGTATTYGDSSATKPMKRRSPSSCSSLQDPSMAATEPESEPRAKKPFFEKNELTNYGFSSISLPVSLRRCSSDPCTPPGTATGGGFPITSFQSPENANMMANPATPSSIRGSSSASGLPHQPPSLKRCVSDPTPSPASSEDTHSSKV